MRRLLTAARERPRTVPASQAPASVQRFVRQLGAAPAYVLDERWRIVQHNEAAALLFIGIADLPEGENTCLWQHFCDARFRDGLVEEDSALAYLAALFRFATAEAAHEDWRLDLVDRLQQNSAAFARRWQRQEVADWGAAEKVFEHAEAGRLTFTNVSHALATMEGETYRVVTYLPREDTRTAERIAAELS